MTAARFLSSINRALNQIGKPSQYGAQGKMASSILLESTAEFTLTTGEEGQKKVEDNETQGCHLAEHVVSISSVQAM